MASKGELGLVFGAQWGDEGKGRIVDCLSKYDVYARFAGGDNAGHTVTVGNEIFKLHLTPSAITRPHSVVLIGRGVVVNPKTLVEEINGLRERGIDINPSGYLLDGKSRLITKAELLEDALWEASGGTFIGTTLRGIGPTYSLKMLRRGPVIDMIAGEHFDEISLRKHFEDRIPILKTLAQNRNVHRALETLQDDIQKDPDNQSKQRAFDFLTAAVSFQPINIDAEIDALAEYGRFLYQYVGNTIYRAHHDYDKGKRLLAEGAQGTLIDIDYGTYPYVTSSHTGLAGFLESFGFAPETVERRLAVTKAFQTRVGSGPFPTELHDDTARHLRGTGENPWDEYGTTTRRARRVGWLDGVLLQYALEVNGATEIALTKIDVLGGLDKVGICTGYVKEGKVIAKLNRIDGDELSGLNPENLIIEYLDGWPEMDRKNLSWETLHPNAQKYVNRVEEIAAYPVTMISYSPEREGIIFRK
ncbi:hypothetical protein A2777_00760 [Candidatus Gottesmanbacteria bacterium RIFCSPHIGHO2_01_FULL_40_15]|uniref:Adenylosuccinate synthetase n=1 Tax=Candidatus Gottesmanbacteria bacterium RIFCSPHIGHO2_01_FULL_40_15 TaxID=1798376 RepID=A0A1F5Z1N6_9BACT|nr:MAG: hypothetical protein A2777_00760 [Candidatus Gottesmanbacteria bacterium RIFCSPHIGHO2_01_FULL_40_15]